MGRLRSTLIVSDLGKSPQRDAAANSSSPSAEFEPLGGAATAVRPLRKRIDAIENQGIARLSIPHRGERQRTAAATGEALDNVIELEPPQLRRAGVAQPLTAPVPARIDLRAVMLAVRGADALVAAAAGALAYRLQPGFAGPIDPTIAFSALAVMAMLVRLPDAESRPLHVVLRRPLSRRLADAALRALLPFAVVLVAVIALVPGEHAARAPLTHWLTLWAATATAGICGVRLGLAGAIAHWRRHGRLKQSVAIFGTGDIAERLLARLRADGAENIELVGIFDDRERRRITNPDLRSLVVGTSDDLVALSRRQDIDRVLVALPHSAEQRVVEVLNKLRQMPVEISLAPDLVGYNVPCREPDEFAAGLPLLDVYGKPLTFGQILLKGAFDRILAALGLLLGAPLLLMLVIAIKLDSKGPVLFRQNRYGFADRLIRVYKFRTMTADTADYNGESQVRRNDPRVTPVGRFLRRWSLDELPQLINVLRGEMSLVGPRPHAVGMRVADRLNHDIVPGYARRHHVKPGITGWAQVKGYHGPVTTEQALRERVSYDLEYIHNWSLWFDVRIMARTIRIILGQRHAY
jgi:polysaccharide biosynthesis protein PslA